MTAERDSTIRILVVDDHAVVRRGLHGFLDGEADLEVVGEAADGGEALSELARLDAEERRPEVVLMDLQMEPVDGIEATRRIRARYDDVQVVALTSFIEEERVHAALEAGASGYILKDTDADDVAGAVRAAHRGQTQLDAAVARRLMMSLPRAPQQEPAAQLTGREREILRLVAVGKANKEIAAELLISERTARTHVSNILRKLGLASRTQAALWAVREGLAPLE
jgi:DNA-binding NarL/FixJ family response regulator